MPQHPFPIFSHFTWPRWFAPIVGIAIAIFTGWAIILLYSAIHMHVLSSMALLVSVLYFKTHPLLLLLALTCCVVFGTVSGILYDRKCQKTCYNPNTDTHTDINSTNTNNNTEIPPTRPHSLPDPHPRPPQFYGPSDQVIVVFKGFNQPNTLPRILKKALNALHRALTAWLSPVLHPTHPTLPPIAPFFSSMHQFFSCLSPTSLAETGWSEHKQCLYRKLVWRVVSIYWSGDPSLASYRNDGRIPAELGLPGRTYECLHLLHNMTYVYEYFYEKHLHNFTPQLMTAFQNACSVLFNRDVAWTDEEKAGAQHTYESVKALLSLNSLLFPLHRLIYQLDSLRYYAHWEEHCYPGNKFGYSRPCYGYGGTHFQELDWNTGERFFDMLPPLSMLRVRQCKVDGITVTIDFFQTACSEAIRNMPPPSTPPFSRCLINSITDPTLRHNIMDITTICPLQPATQQPGIPLSTSDNGASRATEIQLVRLGLSDYSPISIDDGVRKFITMYAENCKQNQDFETCVQDPTCLLYSIAGVDTVRNSILSYMQDTEIDTHTDIVNPYPGVSF